MSTFLTVAVGGLIRTGRIKPGSTVQVMVDGKVVMQVEAGPGTGWTP